MLRNLSINAKKRFLLIISLFVFCVIFYSVQHPLWLGERPGDKTFFKTAPLTQILSFTSSNNFSTKALDYLDTREISTRNDLFFVQEDAESKLKNDTDRNETYPKKKPNISVTMVEMKTSSVSTMHQPSMALTTLPTGSSEFQAATGHLKILLRDPTIFDLLPHLNSESNLMPAYINSKSRKGVKLVVGIPTVKRPNQSYLRVTLRSLLNSMSAAEKNQSLIIIFIAEVDLSYVSRTANEIGAMFPDEMSSGLIEILSPSPSYYPNFSSLRKTLGDDLKRVKWRSKQNLDYAYLMMYAKPKGTYYLQLEDDILSKSGFTSTILAEAAAQTAKNSDWIVLDFCQLGFIGKVIKSSDLPWILEFFLMFFNDQPCDWLILKSIHTKVCRLDDSPTDCRRRTNAVWINYHENSLFQHIGVVSSLAGKNQKLKDSSFGALKLHIAHENPKAEVETSISSSPDHSLAKAYNGETFFLGSQPKKDDFVSFKFVNPVSLSRFLLRSGNIEHPSDMFYTANVFLLSTEHTHPPVMIGSFDKDGIATGKIDSFYNPIKEIRIVVLENSSNSVILSEIFFERDEKNTNV